MDILENLRSCHQQINGPQLVNPDGPAAAIEIELLRGAAFADEERLIAAAKKAVITFVGCDTPDDMADVILRMRAALSDLHAHVWVEAHHLLDEDCGGDAALDYEIRKLIAASDKCEVKDGD